MYLCALLVPVLAHADRGAAGGPGYRLPPDALRRLADAPATPVASLGPDEDALVLAEPPALLALEDLAQPELKLAGLRFAPRTREPTRAAYYRRLLLTSLGRRGEPRPVAGFPAGARLRNLRWSPDGKRLAVAVGTPGGVRPFVVDVASARARPLGGKLRLNGAHGHPALEWLPDGSGLVCRAVAGDRRRPPAPPRVPAGPVIQDNEGKRTPARTYQDLLRDPHDEALFEHHLASQLVRISLAGKVTRLGKPDLHTRVTPSPDGRYLLVETLHRPFSYVVPEHRFPRRIEVWSAATGKLQRRLADVPLQDQVPVDFSAAPTGPRAVEWRADADATLAWVEAQDGGDPRRPAEVRDRLFLLPAPFSGAPRVLASLALRFEDVHWGDDGAALVWEGWWKDRRSRTWRVAPGEPSRPAQLVFERSSEDRYADPGLPALRRTPRGTWVMRLGDGGRTVLLVGAGASPEGDRPFVDRLDLGTGKATRLFRSEAPWYEQPVAVLGDGSRLLTRREAVAEPPNYHLRDLAAGRLEPVTRLPHPTPELRGVKKELLRYPRADGVQLTGTLYLPPGYEPGRSGRLPLLLWVYPNEFKSKEAASQVTDSPYRFVRVSPGSPLSFLARGWAVLDDPTFPIVGEGKREPNDTYVEQLVASAQAAVDVVVGKGVADPERVAVGGHSYGAFTTANLLAHTRLFRAGIARSGAYNRTLTPFSFQAEERTFWEAPETYVKVSPFSQAHRIAAPLLLVHGAEDQNSGTFPMQSERFYQALKGLGGTVRLVMLPHEGHGYRARESVMHTLWEMDRWLERWVKQARPRGKGSAGR